MQYLVAYYKNGREHYLLSASRNAIQHCKETKAKQVQIYDKEGWLLSMANRNEDGEVYRPKLYLDGEAKAFYAKKFVELTERRGILYSIYRKCSVGEKRMTAELVIKQSKTKGEK